MSLLPRIAGAAYTAWSFRAHRRLRAAITRPDVAQAVRWTEIRAGLDLDARGLNADLANNPVVEWNDLRPLTDRIAAGERTALTREPVRFLEPSGGSTGGDKLVPYPPALLAEFGAATTAWVHDLLRTEPGVRGGRAYWAVSPPARRPTVTDGGVPVGVPHDSDYFPPVARRLIDATLGLPRALSGVTDHDAHRYVTLRALLAMDDLALISVWSPSFLTLLSMALDEGWERLLRDLESGGVDAAVPLAGDVRMDLLRALPPRETRAIDLRQRFGRSAPTDLTDIWPRLSLVSCWTDAQAALALPAMRERVPGVRIQGKGLLATEGITSVPLSGLDAPVAAVTSHVLEFLPIDGETGSAAALLERDPLATGDIRAVHELETGVRYETVLTTGGGLVRYRTRDVVEVVGHAPGTPTPLLRFAGRADAGSDLAGEKLVPEVVQRALEAALHEADLPATTWAMLLPDERSTPPRYVLAVDAAAGRSPEHLRDLANGVEWRLAQAHHYALCRDLGQLAAVESAPIADPVRAWTRACADLGQRTGMLKPTALDARPALLPALRSHGR